MNTIDCNKCGYSFDLEDARCGTIEKGDLLVQYFCCPNCRKKYHAFTSDARMRALVEQRKAVQLKIRAAFTKKFRKKTIQEYERKLDRINLGQSGNFSSHGRRYGPAISFALQKEGSGTLVYGNGQRQGNPLS